MWCERSRSRACREAGCRLELILLAFGRDPRKLAVEIRHTMFVYGSGFTMGLVAVERGCRDGVSHPIRMITTIPDGPDGSWDIFFPDIDCRPSEQNRVFLSIFVVQIPLTLGVPKLRSPIG